MYAWSLLEIYSIYGCYSLALRDRNICDEVYSMTNRI